MRSTLRLLGIGWWFQLKMRSRSAFDGILGVIYPMFFATSVLLMYREGGSEEALINAAVGASMLGVWSAVATTAAISLQAERRLGTLELLVARPDVVHPAARPDDDGDGHDRPLQPGRHAAVGTIRLWHPHLLRPSAASSCLQQS